jgi:hypothetical protein
MRDACRILPDSTQTSHAKNAKRLLKTANRTQPAGKNNCDIYNIHRQPCLYSDMPKIKNDPPFMVASRGPVWVYGWTHYRMAGQTQARMNESTNEVEIKDGKKWVKCIAGSHRFFTSSSPLNYSFCESAKVGSWN